MGFIFPSHFPLANPPTALVAFRGLVKPLIPWPLGSTALWNHIQCPSAVWQEVGAKCLEPSTCTQQALVVPSPHLKGHVMCPMAHHHSCTWCEDTRASSPLENSLSSSVLCKWEIIRENCLRSAQFQTSWDYSAFCVISTITLHFYCRSNQMC